MSDLLNKINDLQNEIKSLPEGSISKKKIMGKIYYYHRYTIDGKRVEKYISINEINSLEEKILKRRELKKELNKLKKLIKPDEYDCIIRTGDDLKNFSKNVSLWKKRDIYKDLVTYLNNDSEKVLILYGLRRTGKTTLIRQVLLNMSDDMLKRSAFIQATSKTDMVLINKTLKKLEANGYKYIFIDEVTLVEDFIEGAALFSDIYTTSGMKIVLSGTDSLGFIFTKSNSLYDRCILLHTTYIPYREFERVLGISGIDDYIRFGGTMSMSGNNYNSVFNNSNSTKEYIDSAIAHNITHSLKYYDNESHFRNLYELYKKNELTNVINRVVEDINHRFTKEILTREWKSNDLAISSRNLRNDRSNPTTILDDINKQNLTNNLKIMLEILNESERNLNLEEIHALEIKEYLKLLDLINEVEIRTIPHSNNIKYNTIIAQPGMRYSIVKALIEALSIDEKFAQIGIKDKNYVLNRITSEVMGRMMEEIILLETKQYFLDCEVFKLQFAVGEFDMVVFDKKNITCKIYEIKHSDKIDPAQYRFLIDEEKIHQTEFLYGNIIKKCVIYNGPSTIYNGIEYINAVEYLRFNIKS